MALAPESTQAPTARLVVQDDEIHVWQMDLTDPSCVDFDHSLRLGENQRYARVVVPSARMSWRRSRIALRALLGRCREIAPVELRLRVGTKGKPALEPGQGPLEFNVSHSEGRALIAVATSCIGVDLECLTSRDREYAGILLSACDPVEKHRFVGSGSNDSRNDFFRLRTRKEAYCKATGLGIYKAMDSFRMAEAPGTNASVVVDPCCAQASGSNWYLFDLACEASWMACAGTTLAAPRIQVRRFSAVQSGHE